MFFEKLFARQAYVKNGTGLSWLHVVGVCTFLQVCNVLQKKLLARSLILSMDFENTILKQTKIRRYQVD